MAGHCRFSLASLRYEYPEEIVPPGFVGTFVASVMLWWVDPRVMVEGSWTARLATLGAELTPRLYASPRDKMELVAHGALSRFPQLKIAVVENVDERHVQRDDVGLGQDLVERGAGEQEERAHTG